MRADRRPALEAVVVGTAAVALGQLLLIALSPLSRAASDGVRQAGMALLSPDGLTYLELSADASWAVETPWNRLLLIAILRAGAALGDAASFLVVLQAGALILASALVHRMAARVGGAPAGLIGAIVVAVNPLTAQWVRFVLSETLFLALMLIASYAAEGLLRGAGRRSDPATLLVASILAALLRPNGVLVLGSALTMLAITRAAGRRTAALLIALTWIGVTGGLALGLDAAGQPAERPITAQLYDGVVVEGTDEVLVAIAMPPPADPDDTSNVAGLRYVIREPAAVARLAVTRIVAEVTQVRRHYPIAINIGIGAAMVVLAITTIVGARAPGASPLTRATIFLGLPILLLVGATFATPEGRYGWGALILSAPLAGVGAARILRSVRRQDPDGQSAVGPGTAR